MVLKNKPFTRQSIKGSGQDVITVKLNEDKRAILESAKLELQQPKDSTALWQLAEIGAKVLHSPIQQDIMSTIFNNKRKNKRTGVDAVFG